MCLITNNPKKIADDDIISFKVLTFIKDEDGQNDLIMPIYYNAMPAYTLGKLNVTSIEVTDDWTVADNISADSLSNECPGWKDYSFRELSILKNGIDGYFGYGQGFHSFNSLERCYAHGLELAKRHEVFKCIIPKGSEYIEDNSGCIISNQIIISEIVIRTQIDEEI